MQQLIWFVLQNLKSDRAALIKRDTASLWQQTWECFLRVIHEVKYMRMSRKMQRSMHLIDYLSSIVNGDISESYALCDNVLKWYNIMKWIIACKFALRMLMGNP